MSGLIGALSEKAVELRVLLHLRLAVADIRTGEPQAPNPGSWSKSRSPKPEARSQNPDTRSPKSNALNHEPELET